MKTINLSVKEVNGDYCAASVPNKLTMIADNQVNASENGKETRGISNGYGGRVG